MELEKAIKILNFDIKKWKIKKQHLDLDISTAKINEHHVAIETVLNHLTKQEKMIDLMVDEILILDIKRANYVKDKPRIWETEKGIQQYFEKKVEETN